MKDTPFSRILFATLAMFVLSSCDDFFEEDISDKTIQIVCPADGAELSVNKLSFVWDEEEGVETYHVIIVSPNFNNVQSYVCDTLLADYKFELELPTGDYEWAIRGKNSGYESLTSYQTFKIIGNEK